MTEESDPIEIIKNKPAAKKRAAKKPSTRKKVATILEEDSAITAIMAPPEQTVALVFMKSGASYKTSDGTLFTKEHPFQLVNLFEANTLISMTEDRFKIANADEARKHYLS